MIYKKLYTNCFQEKDLTDALVSVFLLKNSLAAEKANCKIFRMLLEQLKIWWSKSKISVNDISNFRLRKNSKKVLCFWLTNMFSPKGNY